MQPDLFDERNLFAHSDCPGERLVACRNPDLAKSRAHKREELATEKRLVRGMVKRGTLQDKIGVRVGKDRYNVAKHLDIGDDSHRRKEDGIAREAALDGLYVLR